MNVSFAKRLKKLSGENGSFDLQFNTTTGGKVGQIGTSLILTVLKMKDDKSLVDKRVTISAHSEELAKAQELALDSALKLLGV